MSDLANALAEVNSRIEKACNKVHRPTSDVQLIVVSKMHPASLVVDLLNLGQHHFGENKDQEASSKALEVKALTKLEPIWHFVGQLQSNKVKSVLNYASYLHSLDRPSLLTELNKQLAKRDNQRLKVFIELNLTDDDQRGGVAIAELNFFAEQVLASEQLELMGVMAVAGLDVPAEQEFEKVAKASEQLQKLEKKARFISAGMSGDYELAIEYGATHIRVGTAITGKR
jgi:pyridoxal phosphate enzyme (YggS family)